MRFSLGAITVLLLASALASAQGYQSPQEADRGTGVTPQWSLLPDEPQSGISGTLSSWDTSPTGVYKDSRVTFGSPFPMSAAPSIAEHRDRNILPNDEEVPPSMSGNVSSWDTAPTAVYKGYEFNLGSPFPMAADPGLGTAKDPDKKLDDVDVNGNFNAMDPFPDTASPFPTAAVRNW
jgi:hypothetical protein